MIDGRLKAKLSTVQTLKAELNTVQTLKAELTPTDAIPLYEGDYILVPKIKGRVELETKGKKLKDNIVMLEIPIYEVGTVITIG